MIKKDNKFLKYINKNKKTSIIVLLVIILLMGAFLYKFSGKKLNNSEKTDTLYVATAAPIQQGFGKYNVGSRTVYNNMIRNLIHEPLLIAKTKLTKDNKYEKTTYESNILDEDLDEDKTYSEKKTYVLKDNIKFHNGVNLTVDDILYSWKKTKEFGLESARYIESFETVENNPNKFTVKFKNDKNNMNEFYLSKIFVINQKECEKDFPKGITIGLGVFRLKTIKNDTTVQLELFDKHPKKPPQPKITKIHFQYYSDSATCFLATRNEIIDILIEPTNENILEIQNKNINHLQIVKKDFLNLEFILLNNDPPLNFDTRKILYDIIQENKKTILCELLKNQTNEDERKNYQEIDFFSDPRLIGGNMEDKKLTDSAEAEQNHQSTINRFKKECQNKPKIKILITQDENNLRNHFLSKLKAVLEEIGFPCEMEKNDFNAMLAKAQKGDFDIVSFSYNDVWDLLDKIDNIPIEQKPENHSETKTNQYVYVPLFYSKQQKISITRDKIKGFEMDAFGNIKWLDISKTKE
ncbi:MAG: ABC transporter substrate-binding protein [Lettuce witches'-broom phytoplasma]